MSQTALLALDGEGIFMQNMVISPSMQFQEKDQSGQTSSTANAEQGIKAKELRVTGMITFDNERALQRIFQLASATTGDGALKVYRIANATAAAINFREGTFSGQIDAQQQTDRLAWQVSFTLRERRSVPEKRQARAAPASSRKQTPQTPGAKGKTVADETPEKMTWFEEKVLKHVNDALE
ncbi:hypothetical protein NLW11_004945 [Escherichia coli]|uniref:baseplate complex protein n=1 Tax=Escherichia coli TaxID=562 RepID=UPI0017C343EE|nr:hypothetical protein [Escherichia coli]EHT2169742.1 hypothetical protein [Escherichia coli O168]EEZ2512146.1 hypothetical protein [Escherichia coli]EFH2316880.1 hypothetical protein [Escherichia coli]EFL0340489.1 hypothetical protein [Escherichia coli]EJK8612018.1 hypothetical protein [Escherichia coli]